MESDTYVIGQYYQQAVLKELVIKDSEKLHVDLLQLVHNRALNAVTCRQMVLQKTRHIVLTENKYNLHFLQHSPAEYLRCFANNELSLRVQAVPKR